MAEKTTIKIFIASAGELTDEREKSILALTQLNKSHKHLHLEPVLWEIDMVKGNYPDKKSIQDAINPKLKESQVIVFVFYTRIGKNTLLEFELAQTENKKMLVLFREGFSPKKDQLKTYGELLEFKDSMDSILRMSYDDLDKFENLFYTNLNLYLAETYPVKETLAPAETTTLPSSIQKVIQDLTEKDKRIKELEEQLTLKSNNKADDELQKLMAEKEMLHKELQQSEELIKQQAKDKEGLEKQLMLQKDTDDFKAKALKAVEEKDYNTAENFLKESAKGSFSDAASTLSELAKVKKLQFQYGEALNYYEMALRLSPDNSLYLSSAGSVAQDLGYYDKAIEYYEKALAIDKKFFGDEHPDIATEYNNLGEAYDKKGEYDKAIDLYEKALVIDKKFLGEEEPEIAIRYNNLGLVYNNQGKYDKAIEYFNKALAIDKKVYGEEHTSIAIRYNNLGLSYSNKNDYDKAIKFYEMALKIYIKFLGEEHPNVAIDYNNLGEAFRATGKYDQGIEFLNKALAIDTKLYGQEHPSIAIRYNNLGLTYDNMGEFDKAINYYEKALVIDKKFFGKEHPNIAIRYNNLGLSYDNKGEYAKAVKYYLQSLAIFKKFLPPDHPSIQTVMYNLEAAQAALDNQKKKKPGK